MFDVGVLQTSKLNIQARAQEDSRLATLRYYAACNRLPFFRSVESAPGPTSVVEGKTRIMFGSNNSLGLCGDRRLVEAANRATRHPARAVSG